MGERKKGGGSSGRWWEEKREPSILKIFYLDKSKRGKGRRKGRRKLAKKVDSGEEGAVHPEPEDTVGLKSLRKLR